MRVLMLERPHSAVTFGGEQVHLRRLARELHNFGVEVEISTDAKRAMDGGFDLVHLWNIQHPFETAAFVEELEGTGRPSVLTPIYADLRRARFAHRAQEFLGQFHGVELRRRLEDLRHRRLGIDGASDFTHMGQDPDRQAARRYILERVGALLTLTWNEADAIARDIGTVPKILETTPVAPDQVGDASAFRKHSGLHEPFLLVPAARIEPNKNQWLTLLALQDIRLPIVVTGEFGHPEYERLCRRDAPSETHFVGLLSEELLASALSAAELTIHASNIECSSLVAMNAAASTGSLVVGDTGTEQETFAGLARVVDPLDTRSLRHAVEQALCGGTNEEDRREALRERARGFTWAASAEATAAAYERVLASKATAVSRTATPVRPAVHFRGVVLGPSGFAAEGREWLALLEDDGFAPSLEGARLGEQDADLLSADEAVIQRCAARAKDHSGVCLHHMLPGHFEPEPAAGTNVLHSVFEAEGLPPGWADSMNRADQVIVLTEWNRDSFVRAGVQPDKLVVVPPPFATDRFQPQHRSQVGRPFRWLSVFHWQLRKGYDVLLRAFAKTFVTGEAELFLKVTSDWGSAQVQDYCNEVVGKLSKTPPTVTVIDEQFDDLTMPSLYQRADGFVLPSRGEGWGRPVQEAMLMELPVVVSHGSALMTLVPDDSVGYPVNTHLEPVDPIAAEETPCFAGLSWHEPDEEHLSARMREVVQDPAEARRRGKRARVHALELSDPVRIAAQLRDVLAGVGALSSS